MYVLNQDCYSQMLEIVTTEHTQSHVLRELTDQIGPDELPLAQEIGKKLLLALQPYFPAAGLAAPQIGISKAVFIYSYDRKPENLEIVVNPSFEPIGEEIVTGWEGCLSTTLCEYSLKIAKVHRYEKIKAVYFNQNGEKMEKILEGFAAKVFQHEYDHLLGIINIDRPEAVINTFDTKEELTAFMQEVKKEDSTRYKAPNT